MQPWRRTLLALMLTLPAPAGFARQAVPSPASFCEQGIITAERAGRLPPRLLQAIGAVESGRIDPAAGVIRPWPWTINAEGVGQFFASKALAVTAVQALLRRGVRSIDVGCMQVNLASHPTAFASLEAAFDPLANARYAAAFLQQLYSESREWPRAIAAYHSRTPVLGAEYRALVMARWELPVLSQTVIAHAAYRDFLPPSSTYKAFLASSEVYGAFVRPDRPH